MNIEIIETTDPHGNIEEHIVITHPDNSTTSMLKSTWDKLEAAKETGTIS